MTAHANGVPTALGIPTINTAQDNLTGDSVNEIVQVVDAKIGGRMFAPAGALDKEVVKWSSAGGAWIADFVKPSELAQEAATTGQALVWNGTKWAPASSGALQLLWDSDTSGVTFPAASITSPTLSQAYKDLIVVTRARGNGSGTSWAQLQFNGDTGAHYNGNTSTDSNPGGIVGSGGTGKTGIRLGYQVANTATTDTHFYDANDVTVYDYAQATKDIAVSGHGVGAYGAGGDTLLAGVWTPTALAAVTTVTLALGSGDSLVAGSSMRIYGRAG